MPLRRANDVQTDAGITKKKKFSNQFNKIHFSICLLRVVEEKTIFVSRKRNLSLNMAVFIKN
jgi:hypothetical protein